MLGASPSRPAPEASSTVETGTDDAFSTQLWITHTLALGPRDIPGDIGLGVGRSPKLAGLARRSSRGAERLALASPRPRTVPEEVSVAGGRA